MTKEEEKERLIELYIVQLMLLAFDGYGLINWPWWLILLPCWTVLLIALIIVVLKILTKIEVKKAK